MHRIPKKLPFDETRYIRFERAEKAALGGARGEWVYQDDPDDPCFGVARIDKTLDEFEMWVVFREELQHALIDFQRWILLDCPDEEEDETRVQHGSDQGHGAGEAGLRGVPKPEGPASICPVPE